MQVAILTDRKDVLRDFALGLDSTVDWAGSAQEVLDQAKTPPWQLVVVDAMTPGMDYKTFLMDLLRVNAMLFTAVITDADAEAFHEDSEGLGVLCSVPGNPGREHGAEVMVRLRRLTGQG